MLATRWQPFGDLMNEMNRVFSRFGMGDRMLAPAFPALDLWQDADNLYVEAELPGMDLDGLEIYVTGGDQLAIRGRRTPPQLAKGNWHRQERHFGEFTRMLTLPQPVDSERVQAELKCGVLTITLPKRAEARPRRIEVKAE